uniref:Reverse transcriptase Ty1/copia-type domain-containing protein n=1 Tax=Tanacetum cinerariifolium TaxID=118510 RepID=A0A6L2JYC2_TANCI|nr:hypothetical protein [Tanacetum cinerariifolium]
MTTRLQVGTLKPNHQFHSHTSHISPLPKSPYVALSDPHWRDAMYDEYNALIKNGTGILVLKPPNVNVVRSMWLFRRKYHADGSLSRYKARLVVNGRNQQYGVDCSDTFSSVVKPTTIRTEPRTWFQCFAGYALRVGFTLSRCDSSLIIYEHGTEVAYLLIYVDDIVLKTSSTTLLQCIISSLHKKFDMTDLGAFNYFPGILVTRDARGMFLSQKKYDMKSLERAHMSNCNATRAPVDTESKLGYDGDPVSHPLYIVVLQLNAYTNVDWAGYPVTRRSTSGYCVFLRDNLLSWSTKRQVTLSRYSAEAEYRGVVNVVAKTASIRNLLRELHNPVFTATLVYCDNVSAVYMSANPVKHQRTKHIEIDIHFVRDMVTRGHVRVLHVPSCYQYADIFTSGLPTALFEKFHTSLSVRSSPAQTAGEC